MSKLTIDPFGIYAAIQDERDRQERLRAEGKFTQTCASPGMNEWVKYAVLGEEFGEVANAMLEVSYGHAPVENVRKELIQVAAVAVAWLESLSAVPS